MPGKLKDVAAAPTTAVQEGAAENASKLSPEFLLGAIQAVIDRRLRRYTRGRGLGTLDEEDVRQELFLRAYESLPNFDPGRSSLAAYLTTVFDSHVLNLWRHQTAAIRDHRRTLPLVGRSHQGDFYDWSGDIPQDAFEHRSQEEWKHLELDLEAVETRLNGDDRWLATMLREHKLGEIAVLMGRSRSTLQYRVRRLLAVFEDGDLQEFL